MGVFAKIGENPQGRDVCSPDLVSKEGQGRGGHNATEYRLTLDMAKELAMVENNFFWRWRTATRMPSAT